MLMAYLYPKGYSEGSPVGEGLKFGILIGLIWILPLGLILDAVWHLVEEGAGGIVIGLVYGRNARAQ